MGRSSIIAFALQAKVSAVAPFWESKEKNHHHPGTRDFLSRLVRVVEFYAAFLEESRIRGPV